MALLNQFGKKKWRSAIVSEAILAAGAARALSISDVNVDEYGPFTRLHIENNNSTITLQIDLNAAPLGDNTVQTGSLRFFLKPTTAADILPEEDPDKVFYKVSIKNTHGATATAAAEIVWSYANY